MPHHVHNAWRAPDPKQDNSIPNFADSSSSTGGTTARDLPHPYVLRYGPDTPAGIRRRINITSYVYYGIGGNHHSASVREEDNLAWDPRDGGIWRTPWRVDYGETGYEEYQTNFRGRLEFKQLNSQQEVIDWAHRILRQWKLEPGRYTIDWDIAGDFEDSDRKYFTEEL